MQGVNTRRQTVHNFTVSNLDSGIKVFPMCFNLSIFFPGPRGKRAKILFLVQYIFKDLGLWFLPNFPGPTSIPFPTSIPVSRVSTTLVIPQTNKTCSNKSSFLQYLPLFCPVRQLRAAVEPNLCLSQNTPIVIMDMYMSMHQLSYGL